MSNRWNIPSEAGGRALPTKPRRVARDHVRELIEIELPGGAVVVAQGGAFPVSRELVRSEYDFECCELRLTLRTGEVVVAEVGPRLYGTGGRPVVYLDQCHWVNLARHLHAPSKVPSHEREACERVVALARRGALVLPLSAAHLTEAASSGQWRRHLALTMVELSRGWLMESPLDVRHRELIRAFRASLGKAGLEDEASWPFTLEPRALFADLNKDSSEATSRWTGPWPDLVERLSGISAVFAVMLEDAPDPEPRARELAEKWATGHQRLEDYMRGVQMGREHARLNATAALLADLQDEIVRAAITSGMSVDALSHWTQDAVDTIESLPFVGRLRDVIYHRLRGAGRPWETNHLNDLMFLSCAAAYADVVVGENETMHLLDRVGRQRTSGAATFSSLHSAIGTIEALVGDHTVGRGVGRAA